MTWMIYGANGYTGRLIIETAKARGHQPVLAGRHPQRLLDLARETGLSSRIFDLKDKKARREQLKGISAVLHCAGPFSATSKPMLDACLEAKAHYLDITGEIEVFEAVFQRTAEIAAAGVCAIPGVGFDVVPSDCLAAMLKRLLPDANELTLAFTLRQSRTSPGTAKTMVEGLAKGGCIRRGGVLQTVSAAHKTRMIPFPGGAQRSLTVPWGDVATAYHSTKIPNIEVFLGVSKGAVTLARVAGTFKWLFALPGVVPALQKQVERHIPGPTAAVRATSRSEFWGEVRNAQGKSQSLKMTTPDGYALTADAAVRSIEHLLANASLKGALTPSMAFGADFVKELEGVTLVT